MKYFEGAGNLMRAQIHIGLTKASRVKRFAEEMKPQNFRNDLRRELMIDDKL